MYGLKQVQDISKTCYEKAKEAFNKKSKLNTDVSKATPSIGAVALREQGQRVLNIFFYRPGEKYAAEVINFDTSKWRVHKHFSEFAVAS